MRFPHIAVRRPQRYLLIDDADMLWTSTLIGKTAEGFRFLIEDLHIEIVLAEETLEDMFDSDTAIEILPESGS